MKKKLFQITVGLCLCLKEQSTNAIIMCPVPQTINKDELEKFIIKIDNLKLQNSNPSLNYEGTINLVKKKKSANFERKNPQNSLDRYDIV